MAAADHQGVIVEVELLDRERQQRKVLLHMGDPPGECLDRASQDASPSPATVGPHTFSIHQCSQIRAASLCRQPSIDNIHNLLGASDGTRREPFMHQCNALRQIG